MWLLASFSLHFQKQDTNLAHFSEFKAIKEGIHGIVAEESIIGQDGKKKIRIPVRGIKEYQFIFDQGNGSKGVGSAQGQDIKKGQKFTRDNVRVIRHGYGLEPKFFNRILNKKSPINIDKDEPLKTSILKNIN